MSHDLKPSTRKLVRLIGWEADRIRSSESESYLIHRIIIDIGNRTYRELGEERYSKEPWPLDPAVATALLEALQEHRGHAAQDLAFALMRSGAQDAAVLGRLHPTDRLIYHWIDQGLNAAGVAEILREAGLVRTVGAAELARIDDWIAKPLTAHGKFETLMHLLFDHDARLVQASVRDPGFELHHDELLTQLLSSAAPPIVIEEVSQRDSPSGRLVDVTEGMVLTMQVEGGTRTFTVGDDPQLTREGARIFQHDGRGIVQFKHAGRTHGFFVESQGAWMDVAAVLHGVDALMADLGRPDRAFQFAVPRGENGEWPLFMVADPARLEPAAARLGLPVSRAGAAHPV